MTSERNGLINCRNLGGRGAVIYRLADDNVNTNPINNRAFIDAEYNRAFVYGEYSGYLRRNSDIPGFLFWLGQVNSGPLRDLETTRDGLFVHHLRRISASLWVNDYAPQFGVSVVRP